MSAATSEAIIWGSSRTVSSPASCATIGATGWGCVETSAVTVFTENWIEASFQNEITRLIYSRQKPEKLPFLGKLQCFFYLGSKAKYCLKFFQIEASQKISITIDFSLWCNRLTCNLYIFECNVYPIFSPFWDCWVEVTTLIFRPSPLCMLNLLL